MLWSVVFGVSVSCVWQLGLNKVFGLVLGSVGFGVGICWVWCYGLLCLVLVSLVFDAMAVAFGVRVSCVWQQGLKFKVLGLVLGSVGFGVGVSCG